ncbi:uncharacterized protein EDB91DRAFT_1244189 [Suillus paluster]|uniref:uncharacterized protein n=1 Tax=Suillus paluster TaxID=48578 RepID=UPI001B870297|nr:uncharacterized protein EDB91DRAFT_1244189 [Suillus paluster]KAG1750610.1 hypothetical protein EDB91DRAFT_1244189 [Suillus paluster]
MSSANKGKWKVSVLDTPNDRLSKPHTLGGDQPRETVIVREVTSVGLVLTCLHLFEGADLLSAPPQLTFLSVNVEGSDFVFGARNSDGDGVMEVTFVDGKQTLWLDYLPYPVLVLTTSTTFCAAVMQDGSVNMYSHTGQRLIVTLSFGSPCAMMHGCKLAGKLIKELFGPRHPAAFYVRLAAPSCCSLRLTNTS